MRSEAASPKPSQRRRYVFRFSMTALLLLVTVVAVFLGWLRYELARTKQETLAIAKLSKVIGDGHINVSYGHRFYDTHEHYMLPFVPQRSRQLEQTLGFDPFRTVKRISIYAIGNTMEYQRNENGTLNVKATYVAGLKDEDADLLINFKQLEVLMLEGSPIGNQGMRLFAGLKRLNFLNLAGSKVTHEGMRHLAGLRALKQLNISNTDVKDATIDFLIDLSLATLVIEKTNISKQAITKFKKRCPDCAVRR